MKILLVTNKTYRGHLDGGYYNLFLPLQQLGHEVYFYDTVNPEEKDFTKVLHYFGPDLIFCCMTGDRGIAPYEPWSQILEETQSGRTKTFNWFCDDTWRFDNFSSKVCRYFTHCSTPEPSYINKYKSIGYGNITVGNWHVNDKILSYSELKDIDISFIGFLTASRKSFFETVKKEITQIENFHGLDNNEMHLAFSRSRMGINLASNDNDISGRTQMKLRMFEIPAFNSMMITQYHEDLKEFYEFDKEIITFKTIPEFIEKTKFLLKRPKLVETIASNGHERFLRDHTSEVRLTNILNWINNG